MPKKEDGEEYSIKEIQELEKLKDDNQNISLEVETMAIYQQRTEELEADLKSYVKKKLNFFEKKERKT